MRTLFCKIMALKQIFFIIFTIFLSSCKVGNTPADFDVWGIDISKHQRKVNWDVIMENNAPHFVFLKVTEGTLIIDPTYDDHKKELKDRDVIHGAYHFFGHRTCGKEQARAFIKNAKLERGDMIPVLDIEKHRFMVDPKKSVVNALKFSKEIKRYYGVNPIIYCSTLFYHKYLEEAFGSDEYTLWIADYRKKPITTIDWNIWQHTERHNLKGTSGLVDRNVFVGSKFDFNKLILQ